MKNDVVDNSERDAWALWREQGTDHALFDRSEKPLGDLAMMCSAAVGEGEVRKGWGSTRKDVPSQVPGTKVAPQKKKRTGRRGQCNALQCKCNATQTEGGRKKKIIDKIQCKGGGQILDLARSLLLCYPNGVAKSCRGE